MAELPRIDRRWIEDRRPARNVVDPSRAYTVLVEPERQAGSRVESVLTIFITNRECPFRCLMCDLWKNTTIERTPEGAVAGQVREALAQHPDVPHVKLYNSGNFFDEAAISRRDREEIVELVRGRKTVIVECHPRLVDERCIEFARRIEPALQVAMGLETVDPEVLPRLNKQMTLDDFQRATELLLEQNIPVRAFILLRTPFQTEAAGVDWAKRAIDYAFSIGVECCAVVPTRAGNGAMDELQRGGWFEPPSLSSMEDVLDYGIDLDRGRMFVDLWDVEKFFGCSCCGPARARRMANINASQSILSRISCSECETKSCTIRGRVF